MLPRGRLTISISLANIKNRYKTVSEACLSSVRQAAGEILSQKMSGATPARISFTIEEVYGQDQVQLALGAHYSDGLSKIKGQFDFKDKKIRSRILVKFIQVYYSLDVDPPASPSAFFKAGSSWTDLAAKLTNVSPVYVASINYGRMALFAFESYGETASLKAAVNYAYNSILSDGGASVDARHKQVLNSSSIRAYIIGGSGSAAVGAVRGFDGLKKYLLSGGNFTKDSPAAPLSYKLRYLSDNSICSIVLTAEYSVRRFYRNTGKFRLYGFSLRCDREDDGGEKAEFYGQCRVEAFTNSVAVQGYRNGTVCSSLVWDVPSSQSSGWELAAGEEKQIKNEIIFTIKEKDLDTAVLKVGGWIKENDPFSDDDLGTQFLAVAPGETSDKIYYTPAFISGGTQARFGFRVERIE